MKMSSHHDELIERIFPGLVGYEALETPAGFFSKTATLVFPTISIMAMAMSASRVKRDGRLDSPGASG
jgi:hypothetical protein